MRWPGPASTAPVLLKRTWQVHEQLGYFLLYGSFEANGDLGAFCSRCGYTVHDPGETGSLDRVGVAQDGARAGPQRDRGAAPRSCGGAPLTVAKQYIDNQQHPAD
ncbi:hypothetical protein ACIHCQ_39610 [Streptomyces sp. NPDC052236]|uniref:hypothetical protein n=1 Tax=Streptomyces sp. NPDC052236 TaxID=3365686 RepID=UPI0037CD9A12